MFFLPYEEEGQGLLEYALVIALVAIIVVAVLILLGPAIGDLYSTVTEELPF